MPDDDALKRRLQAYFSDLEGEAVPSGIDRLQRPEVMPADSWRERFLIPAIGVGVAAVIFVVVVLVFFPGRRNEEVDAGASAPNPTRASTTSTTLGGTTRTTPSTIPPTLATARPSTTTAPTTTTPSTTSSTSTPSTTVPTGQLLADDFSSAQVGSVPLGWTVDSGSWSVIQSGNGKALQGTTPKGQEGRISNGSASWTDVKVSASVRRDETNTVAGVAARYQNAGNHYFCKLDGGQLAVGKVVGDKSSILSSTKSVNVPQGQVVTLALIAKGNLLQCAVNGANVTNANDGTFTTGRMALVQDGQAAFGTVVVTST